LSSTTTRTASNGVADINKRVPAQREHGRARLREDECYHLTNLIKDCLDEAEHLVRKVHGKAFNRNLDYDGTKGTAPLDTDEATQVLNEARECAQAAVLYLVQVTCTLTGNRNDQDDDDESPF
jgi:hypothetical protein